MSAIRPLATIAMLMVLGYVLWTRINSPGLEQTSEAELALTDAPALELDLEAGSESLTAAPPIFTPAPSASPAPTANNTTVAAAPPANTIKPLDASPAAAMPELPPLPANIPTADYSTKKNDPPKPTVPAEKVAAAAPPVAPVVTPAPAAAAPAPAATASSNSRYNDAPADNTLPMGAASEFAPSQSEFAKARKEIDAALTSGEIEKAHLLLTTWYGDRTLTAGERDEVEGLLGQLAGTVIYSQEHRLEAPHRVQPGETLETIAEKYQVPWQLLAKINGVAQPSSITPGQELKVIRGPFSAVVDVERQQLALIVSDRYAGRFSVKTEGQAAAEGEWVITQKQLPSDAGATSKQMMLGPSGGYSTGTTLVLGPASDTAPATAGAIRVGPTDQDDLFDILSIGSRVIIRK